MAEFFFHLILAAVIGALMTASSMVMGSNYPVLQRISNGDGTAEAAYAIFGPVFFQCIAVFIFDHITSGAWGTRQYYSDSWVAILLYRIAVIVFAALKNQNERSFYWLFAVRTALCAGLSFYLSLTVLAQDVSQLIPSTEDIVFQFWTLFAVVALGFLSTANDGEKINYERLFYQIDNLANENYPKKFRQDHILRALYCALGMVEAYYRPKPFRILERIFFFLPNVKTTGIMQVEANRPLSDRESIELAFPEVERIWNEFLTAKWSQAENNADVAEAGKEPIRPFNLTEDGYSYSLNDIEVLARECFPSLHLRYMGTSRFELGSDFFLEAFNCIREQLYRPGNIVVKVQSSAFDNL